MLHTVNKSPFEKNSLETCLRLSQAGSAVLLLEDGVYGALQNTTVESQIKSGMQTKKFYVLGPDLSARGLDKSKLIGDIDVVDYDGFVKLTVEHDKIQSWL